MHLVLNVHRAGSSALMPFSLGPDSQQILYGLQFKTDEALSLPVKHIKVSRSGLQDGWRSGRVF